MAAVVEVDPRTDPRWRDLVDREHGSVFHSATWSAVLADTYGFTPRATVVLEGDRAESGIAWCRVDDPGGARIVSLPFSDYCGPLAASSGASVDGSVAPALVDALLAHGLPLRCRVLTDPGATDELPAPAVVAKRARWHGVTVTASPELDTWPELASSTRRAVTKARRDGVHVEARPDAAFVDRFFTLHCGVRKHKYRLLPQPRAFFTALREHFTATCGWHPLAAVRDGEVIAATVYLRHRDTLYYKFNASDPAGLASRPNDLLLWSGIELAARLGCRLLDLGASDDDQPGLIRFKRGFAASEREIRTWVAGPPPPDDAERFHAVLHDITRRVTAPDVPDRLTEDAGAWLYRYFA